MTLFIWKKSYEIGVSEIDVQHRRLIGLINELSDAMMEMRGQKVVPRILNELAAYIQEHFATEEAVMENSNFPKFAEHKKTHQDLTRKVHKFREDYESGKPVNSKELLDFICEWFKYHIMGSDMDIGEHLQRIEKAG